MARQMNGWEMSEAISTAIRQARGAAAQRCYEIAKEREFIAEHEGDSAEAYGARLIADRIAKEFGLEGGN